MNDFKIFALGVNFDVDTYAESETIGFDHVWHVGEGAYKSNGLEKTLGDGAQLNLHEQDRIATEFLEEHQAALAELSKYPGVETVILGLQFRVNLGPSLRGFTTSFSSRLMDFALRAGVEPNVYVDLAPTVEWDEYHKPIQLAKPRTEILLTTSIIMNASSDEDGASRRFEEISDQLRTTVGQSFRGSPDVQAVGSISSLWLEEDSLNSGRCSMCSEWVTDRDQPNTLAGLSEATVVEGKLVCDVCRTSCTK